MRVVHVKAWAERAWSSQWAKMRELERLPAIRGLRHYLYFSWKLMKASVEAFTAFIKTFLEDIEAMEASMLPSKQLKRLNLPWKLPSKLP